MEDQTEYSSDRAIGGNPLRPNSFNEYIGQRKIIQQLEVFIEAVNKRRARGVDGILGHMIIDGAAGLGKTSIANATAKELKANLIVIQANSIEHKRDLYPILFNLEEGDLLFIDEIHALDNDVAEVLYSVTEDFRLDVTTGETVHNFSLNQFTLIGATTDFGKLSNSLRQRFIHKFTMTRYTQEELALIIGASVRTLGYEIDVDARLLLASFSKGVPRLANNLANKACAYSEVEAHPIDVEMVTRLVEVSEIYELGIDFQDKAYLEALYAAKSPQGIKTLVAKLNRDEQTIVNTIEPYLIEQCLVEKQPRGRVLTEYGRELTERLVK